MKITKINTKRVKIPLVEPFHISLGVITHAEQILVEIETEDGRDRGRLSRCLDQW